MTGKRFAVAVGLFAVLAAAFFGAARLAFRSPRTCNACHFVEPYYRKWETSTHRTVPCLRCHDYSPERALAGQFMFLAGAQNPRPLARIPDASCLQSGCHEQRLVVSKVKFTRRGITFDHAPHFQEMKRGIRLHCRSCHSDIVQGEHVRVSMNVCHLCHFKGVPHDRAKTGCPSCHGAPKEEISWRGKPFSHAAALRAGHACSRCHLEISRGDGVTPREKCFFCHVDRAERYSDVNVLHAKHVSDRQIDCLYCHPRIEHGKFRMADDMPQ